jgi:TPR repeat protein
LQDDKEAVKWFRLAAGQGSEIAQYNLGVSYHSGLGVLTNYIISYSWTSLARYNGDTDADELLNTLGGLMSNSDVSEAQSLSKRCLESDYKDCG